MCSVHWVDCESYDVSGQCQNFLDSNYKLDSYFGTEGVLRSKSYIGDYILPGSMSYASMYPCMTPTVSVLLSCIHSTDGTIDDSALLKQIRIAISNSVCAVVVYWPLILLQAWYKLHKSTFLTLHSTEVIILSLPRIPTTAYHFGGISQTILSSTQ